MPRTVQAPFDGIIVVNSRSLDLPVAQLISEIFSEVIIAPPFFPRKKLRPEERWLGPRELVHRGWDDFPIKKENQHEKDEKDSGANHPDTA